MLNNQYSDKVPYIHEIDSLVDKYRCVYKEIRIRCKKFDDMPAEVMKEEMPYIIPVIYHSKTHLSAFIQYLSDAGYEPEMSTQTESLLEEINADKTRNQHYYCRDVIIGLDPTDVSRMMIQVKLSHDDPDCDKGLNIYTASFFREALLHGPESRESA